MLKHSLQRFLTGIKTRKRKREKEKREEKNFFFTYIYSRLTQLFYMKTADRLTPLVDVATLHNQLPSPLERGSFFFLTKMNIQFYIRSFFFLYFLKRKRKKKGERKAGKKKNNRRENLAGRFSYSKLLFILIRIFFLTDKRKTIF